MRVSNPSRRWAPAGPATPSETPRATPGRCSWPRAS